MQGHLPPNAHGEPAYSRLNARASPCRLQALPAGLGALTALKELSLAGNQLEGPLPASLGQLASLTKLSLHGNRLGPGSLPASLSGLQALEELWLQVGGWVGSRGALGPGGACM
jgi:Leucine-rich repeat (LRR) protein